MHQVLVIDRRHQTVGGKDRVATTDSGQWSMVAIWRWQLLSVTHAMY